MKSQIPRFPLVKLPVEVQESLYLIKEELKSRKLFHALHEVGLDDCFFQPHLDSLILRSIGLDDGTDETFMTYYTIVERRSRKIEADNDSIMKQALKVYNELILEKKKRKENKRGTI
jgi:hypothetical protein